MRIPENPAFWYHSWRWFQYHQPAPTITLTTSTTFSPPLHPVPYLPRSIQHLNTANNHITHNIITNNTNDDDTTVASLSSTMITRRIEHQQSRSPSPPKLQLPPKTRALRERNPYLSHLASPKKSSCPPSSCRWRWQRQTLRWHSRRASRWMKYGIICSY